MGAGKTVLVGTIVATEFAMALEYPDAGDNGNPFIENALVFAPGTTILESLRELSRVPYDRVLPPRLHRPFAASLKITFTNGERLVYRMVFADEQVGHRDLAAVGSFIAGGRPVET